MNNKRIISRLLLAQAILLLLTFARPAGAQTATSDTYSNPVFEPVLARLRARTGIPLRLPRILGGDYDAALYAETGPITRTGYHVRIGQNCERSYCPYGTVSGKRLRGGARRPRGKVVELSGGLKGYLTDGSKTYTDSVITWDEGRYRYTIALYAADPSALIKIANSTQ